MQVSRIIATVIVSYACAMPAFAQNAEDLYRDARRALNRQQFAESTAAFQQLRARYPDSPRVAESYYWEAFALERDGALDAAVAALDTLLREHPDAATVDDARALRLQICGELAQRGDTACAAEVAASIRQESGVDESTRSAALNALLNMQPERAIPLATQVLQNERQSLEIRKQALFVLADHVDDANAAEITATLLDTARDTTNDLELRGQAVFWLSAVPGDATLDALAELLQAPEPAELGGAAVYALSQLADPRATELLRDLAANETASQELRKQAVVWIGEQGGEQALPFLMDLHSSVTSPELKQQILFAAAQTGSRGALDWLVARANDAAEAPDSRKQALFWAADAGLPLEQLIAFYRNTSEQELRQHAIWLMSEHDDPAALDRLLEIARTDPDPELRQQAVSWIGNIDDARSEQYLRELLEP